jgi:uncharacterized protein (DUF433 family)
MNILTWKEMLRSKNYPLRYYRPRPNHLALLGRSRAVSVWDRRCGGQGSQRQVAFWREFNALGRWLSGGLYGKVRVMALLDRITHDPTIMGGKPCIRGMRVTVGTILGLLASGHGQEQVLALYPYLEAADVQAALAYAAWRTQETELPLS